MRNALIILHSAPESGDGRALTAVRLAGAMLADGKEVTLFLVESGLQLANTENITDSPAKALFSELVEAGMAVHVCGKSMRDIGWTEENLPSGVSKSSMKMLSTLLSAADELVSF
ncbi:DsrE family protein [Thermithiobacillus plumbiphilus]|uniref:DsrE family protein n=1 Tax=Thermithiobacillus plumbiphilus TaxID=1729899 RepID=A0ABU9DDG9_9PROT